MLKNPKKPMKKWILILVLLTLLPATLAQEEYLYRSEYLVIRSSYWNDLTVVKEGVTPKIDEITANFSFFPREAKNQEVISMSTEGKTVGDDLIFRWKDPEDKVSIRVDSVVKTKNDFVRITDKVPFPLKDLESGL